MATKQSEQFETTQSQLEGLRKIHEQLMQNDEAVTRAREIAQGKLDRDRELYVAVKIKYDVAALIRGKDVTPKFDGLVPIVKPPAGTTGNFLVIRNRGRDIESVEAIKDESPTDTPPKHEGQETETPSKITKRKKGGDNERKRRRLE
ncbi:hypothetical protein H2199_008911 [Coniosporium tulheliwenetii]|uniref:Uncharacterized protein n=1 Tax=Coniosporium tulheliwenetii TaxID=3383036 RepID=A0ACC2YGX2_9PEZI|nr:hypothetical protein H2199_008911 [Cladosporium sp. JES 115]